MLVIDEIARMMGSQSERRKMLKEVTHKMVGGGGRQRSDKAKQDSTLADLRWRVMSLWSGENSLDPEFLGGVRERGELVRLIEIPVPKPGSSGIFDRLGDSQLSAIGLAKITEEAIKKNFGHPIRAFIEHLVSDPEKYGRRATQLLERFLEKVSAGNDPWTRRFATKFAVVYAAARLAAELEMAPWPKTHPLKCVKRLYNKARALVVTPEEALQDLLARLARNASSTRRFPVVAKGKALPAHLTKVAWGVRGKSYDGIPVVAVSTDRVDGLVRPAHYANRVRELLSERGYLVRGKEGRRVRQIQVQGFGSTEKPYFLCVRLDRLPQNKP
jgi:hypothetical protein